MSYLISTEIKGVAYYARITRERYPVEYAWEGLKNNATKYDSKDYALGLAEIMESKTPLQVIPKNK